jgi:hypothetical protein
MPAGPPRGRRRIREVLADLATQGREVFALIDLKDCDLVLGLPAQFSQSSVLVVVGVVQGDGEPPDSHVDITLIFPVGHQGSDKFGDFGAVEDGAQVQRLVLATRCTPVKLVVDHGGSVGDASGGKMHARLGVHDTLGLGGELITEAAAEVESVESSGLTATGVARARSGGLARRRCRGVARQDGSQKP